MKPSGVILPLIALLVLAGGASAQSQGGPIAAAAAAAHVRLEPRAAQPLNLEACLALAMKNSTRRRVAASSTDVALARQGQAQSSRYPELSASLTATRLDEDPNFIFPTSSIAVPASTMRTSKLIDGVVWDGKNPAAYAGGFKVKA